MDKKLQTIQTYNKSAEAFAKKFDISGARIKDIQETFAIVKKENPRVFEIGCGNGRDAKEIVKYTSSYFGIDISEKLIELAQINVPKARFDVADIENYIFSEEFDIIFSFASLMHVPKESLEPVFIKSYKALSPNGIFRLSLKQSDTYKEVTQEDEFGIRTYYFYSKKDIESIARGFTVLQEEHVDLRGQIWLELTLQKIN